MSKLVESWFGEPNYIRYSIILKYKIVDYINFFLVINKHLKPIRDKIMVNIPYIFRSLSF